MINIAIRATYYIFCHRNRNWDSPDLMQFWFLFFSLLFFFWIIQSQAAFVNCLYVARFTIVHSKTQNTVSIIIIIKYYFLPSSREGIPKKGTTDMTPHRLLESLSIFSYICLKLRVTKGLVIIYYYSTHSFNLFWPVTTSPSTCKNTYN